MTYNAYCSEWTGYSAIYRHQDPKPWKEELPDGTTVVRSGCYSPPGCHSVGCGIKFFVKDGKIVKVEGDTEQPITQGRLCVRGLTMLDYIYHPDRILYPMKRVGNRGENKWERLSWDDALALIKAKYDEITAKYGTETCYCLCGTGREAVAHQYDFVTRGLMSPNVA